MAVRPALARYAETARRGVRAGSATPKRLTRVGAALIVGCLAFGVISVASGAARTDAVDAGRTRIEALAVDAAQVYQALADADAMGTSGYVAGGVEPGPVRARYDGDIERAADRLVHAAALAEPGDDATAEIATINARLPVYAGLLDTARTLNRQGRPLGQSYLQAASALMQTTVLPAAENLRQQQVAALADTYARGGRVPFAALLVGLAALVAVVDVSFQERRRTNRAISVGLVVGVVALGCALAWWVVTITVVGSALADARGHSEAAATLDEARVAALQARSNEALVLVARSGGVSSDSEFTDRMTRLLGADGLLAAASGTEGAGPRIDTVRSALLAWQQAHRTVRELDESGRYPQAVASVIGTGPVTPNTADTSGARFDAVDRALTVAVDAERDAFGSAVSRADAVQTGLVAGPPALAVLAAVAVAWAVALRIGEYR